MQKSSIPIKSASILICLEQKNLNFQILMLKRSVKLSSFRGMYCFPGGTLDKSDMDYV
jgi:8-oxo-dGTP pyrophosphatase MutT (NUDIX family)